MTHPNLIATAVTVTALGTTVVVARQRIRHWKQWGMQVFDHFADSLTDRLDVDIDLDGVA